MFYPLQLIINVTYSRRRVGGGAMQASLVAVTRGRKIRTFNVTKKRLPGTYKGGRQAGTPTILTENDKTENRHVNVFFSQLLRVASFCPRSPFTARHPPRYNYRTTTMQGGGAVQQLARAHAKSP